MNTCAAFVRQLDRRGSRAALANGFFDAEAILWNSLLSESVFPPTCVPQALHV